ncbi:hypothetical protein [Pseudoalteromonas sp. OOF1S-7]|nr:hypothetical protein [Pseudoalteromonas sp. OOF1S-7]
MKADKNSNILDVVVKWLAIAVATVFALSGVLWLMYVLVSTHDG